MTKTIRILVLLALLLATIGGASAKDVHKRKKVAVVLSGGGAKGMAHIGVLKVLEQAGIPIDIITGTSMGSIVGGLYAIGYNAHALDSVVHMQDWSYVITDKEQQSKLSLTDRKKLYTYVYSTGMTIGKRNQNDGGFLKGNNLAELFQNLCVGYTDSLDFSRDLPIPFACVATDIVNYEEYDFHSGKLPQAMRASMAIPAVFSPVRMEGRVLVDGGMRNNYPADIARQMGADIIIGVLVQEKPKTADDMWGTVGILTQIVDVNCKNKYEENLAITDIPIHVDPTGYSAASFSATAIDTLMRRGEEEAMKHWDELIALKKRIGISQDYRPHLLSPLLPTVMSKKSRVTAYEFKNMTRKDERFLRDKFRLKANENDSMDAYRKQALTTSMRMDLFYQSAECQTIPDSNGVRIVLKAGNRKTNQLHVGLRYDSEEHASLQVGANVPLKAAIPVNADCALRLGRRLMARGELTFHAKYFACPTLTFTYRRNDIDIYINGERDYNVLYNQYQADFVPLTLDVRHFILKMGLRWDYIQYRNKLESNHTNTIKLDTDHYLSYRALLNYNSEDNWNFPTRGARFRAEYAYYADKYTQLDGHKFGISDINAHWRKSFTIGSRFTLQPMLYGRLLIGTDIPFVFGNTIGGNWFGHYVEQQMPFAGIGNMEYVDKEFIAGQMQAQQRIGKNHYVLLRVAGGLQCDRLRHLLDQKMMLGCQGSYYYNTMFGPIGGSLGYSNRTKEIYLHINLGYEF